MMCAHHVQYTKFCLAITAQKRFYFVMRRRQILASAFAMPFLQTGVAIAATPSIEGVDLALDVDPDLAKSSGDLISQWITKSNDAVRGYYGRFPVPKLSLNIRAVDGGRVNGGNSEPGPQPVIDINVGREASADELLHNDWVLVHEMIHMAIPYVPRYEFWAAEGLAVYVESIARIQAGHIAPEPAWHDFMRRMPGGLPKADEGLSQSRDHNRVYWGGALFFLEADIRIREKSDNKVGLQTALRAINASHDFRDEMQVADFFPVGDKATGTDVLMTLYHEMAMTGGSPDLAKRWAELGVIADGDSVRFDANAPKAALREAMLKKMA
jgi:hypothetical protein